MRALSRAQHAEVGALLKRKRALRPEDVVAAAARKNSALHRLFVWDDERAGALYRIETAREVLDLYRLSVRVQDASGAGEFVIVPGALSRGAGYHDTEFVMRRATSASAQIVYEWARLAASLSRFERLCLVAPHHEAQARWAARVREEGARLVRGKNGGARRRDDRPQPSA